MYTVTDMGIISSDNPKGMHKVAGAVKNHEQVWQATIQLPLVDFEHILLFTTLLYIL